MMLNPTLGNSGGSGPGPDPDPIVDNDVDIYVGNAGTETFAAARAAAMTYRGRMASGRSVTIWLPTGTTPVSSADMTFNGIDFPELRILGQSPWGTAFQTVTITAVSGGHDLIYDVGVEGYFSAGEIVIGYVENGLFQPGIAHPLSVVSAVGGCHEVVEAEGTTVRVHVAGANPALASVAGSTLTAAALGAEWSYWLKKMQSVLVVDGDQALSVTRSHLAGISDVAILVSTSGSANGILIDESTFGRSRNVSENGIIALMSGPDSTGYSSALTVMDSDVKLPVVVSQPRPAYPGDKQGININNCDIKIVGLFASDASINSNFGARRVEITSGLMTGSMTLEGTVDLVGNRMLFWAAPVGSETLVQASRGARVWLSDPSFLDGQSVTVSPPSGVPGNDGAEVYIGNF